MALVSRFKKFYKKDSGEEVGSCVKFLRLYVGHSTGSEDFHGWLKYGTDSFLGDIAA